MSSKENSRLEFILDYRAFIERKLDTEENRSNLNHLFYSRNSCPFCNIIPKEILEATERQGTSIDHVRYTVIVHLCKCGWWEIVDGFRARCYGDYVNLGKIKSAILKEFSTNDCKIPLDILKVAVAKNPDFLYGIHHKKMEELVGSVLSEHFACDVKICGQSHDGGFDLILVDAECPTLVQVKRRQSPFKIEPVSEIRHLLGATLLAGAKACAYVTTADHFSPEAQKSADLAIRKKLVNRYDLFNVHRFIDILRLSSQKGSGTWKSALPQRWINHETFNII